MASRNTQLNKAKSAKVDEFYTQLQDIERELVNYADHLRGKVVLCNCDDPTESKFWEYFRQNFRHLGLKRLVATHFDYDERKPTYKLEYSGNGKPVKTPLRGNGDFRSAECIDLLQEADIVVTNPPFSLFRAYLAQLMEHDKKFLIIGNMIACHYKDVRSLIIGGKIWLGCREKRDMKFLTKDNELKAVNAVWFTNLTHSRQNEKLPLYEKYSPSRYPKYDNYDAIEVGKVKEIPADWDGEMGVPETFLTKHNPNQFELIGFDDQLIEDSAFYIDGKRKYARLVIKRKKGGA